MLRENKTFFAIIIGAGIIAVAVYFGLSGSPTAKQINQAAPAAKAQVLTQSPAPVIKSDLKISTASCGAENNTIVTKVIDGDTVVVEGGYHVRLLGIDADETGYPCYQTAKAQLESLVLGKQVILEKDKTDLDQYGRCLRYIFVASTNVDVQLVKEGMAIARFYEPNVKYKPEITTAEKQAQISGTGCKWSGKSYPHI